MLGRDPADRRRSARWCARGRSGRIRRPRPRSPAPAAGDRHESATDEPAPADWCRGRCRARGHDDRTCRGRRRTASAHAGQRDDRHRVRCGRRRRELPGLISSSSDGSPRRFCSPLASVHSKRAMTTSGSIYRRNPAAAQRHAGPWQVSTPITGRRIRGTPSDGDGGQCSFLAGLNEPRRVGCVAEGIVYDSGPCSSIHSSSRFHQS
jgi:hypothetical protein